MIMDETAWFAVCFVVFILLAFKPAKGAILGFLDGKIKEIRDALAEAQNAKIEAEKELKSLHQEIADADHRHKEMLERAKNEIDALYKERCATFKKTMEYREEAAKASLEQVKIDAASAVEGAFLGLVVDAVAGHMQKNASGKMDVNLLKNAS